MGQLKLSGSIDAGPPTVSSETFPASSFSVPLAFRSGTRSFGTATGVLVRTVAVSSPAFLVIATITRGGFLYLKTSGPLVLRLTVDDGSLGNVLELVPVDGLLIREFPSNLFLKQVEIQGSGTIEFFVSGE